MKRPCSECGQRPALFRSSLNKRVRADKTHTLCRACWKAYKDRQREGDRR